MEMKWIKMTKSLAMLTLGNNLNVLSDNKDSYYVYILGNVDSFDTQIFIYHPLLSLYSLLQIMHKYHWQTVNKNSQVENINHAI